MSGKNKIFEGVLEGTVSGEPITMAAGGEASKIYFFSQITTKN